MNHLGNFFTNDLSDATYVAAKKCDFIRCVNRLNVQFRNVQDTIRIRVLQTSCTPWYGSQIWYLNSEFAKHVVIELNTKAVRRLRISRRSRLQINVLDMSH